MDARRWSVFCLCAEWCGVCRDWRGAFESLGREHPGVRLEWVDIEDEADIVGDLDVETFPTLLICDDAGVRFFGPVLPRAEALTSLLRSLQATPATTASANEDITALCERLRMRA